MRTSLNETDKKYFEDMIDRAVNRAVERVQSPHCPYINDAARFFGRTKQIGIDENRLNTLGKIKRFGENAGGKLAVGVVLLTAACLCVLIFWGAKLAALRMQ